MTKQEIRMAFVVIVSVLIGEAVFHFAERSFHASPAPSPVSVQRHGACESDVQKFCPNGLPTGLGACLFQHLFELEPGCRDQYPQDFPKFQACWSDIFAFCRGVAPGENRIPKCLRDNAKDVSATCKASSYYHQR